jgi:hypothetical protein
MHGNATQLSRYHLAPVFYNFPILSDVPLPWLRTRGREIMIINAVILVLMLLAVLMRFCVRRSGNTAFSWDGCQLIHNTMRLQG